MALFGGSMISRSIPIASMVGIFIGLASVEPLAIVAPFLRPADVQRAQVVARSSEAARARFHAAYVFPVQASNSTGGSDQRISARRDPDRRAFAAWRLAFRAGRPQPRRPQSGRRPEAVDRTTRDCGAPAIRSPARVRDRAGRENRPRRLTRGRGDQFTEHPAFVIPGGNCGDPS